MAKKDFRPDRLQNAPMAFAPQNELGVVFLFSHFAKKWRLTIDRIQPAFPDCIAYQKAGGREKKIRIEFEYKARSFLAHGHNPKKCDWIVCWENNWPDAPKHLVIRELRREFGLGFNVWTLAVGGKYKAIMDAERSLQVWSVPYGAHPGDLLLYYFNRPEMCVKYAYKLVDPVKRTSGAWKADYKHLKPGRDYQAKIARVCEFKDPLKLEKMKEHRLLKDAGFVRGNFQGRHKVTAHWPDLYEALVDLNPSVRKKLSKYEPSKVGIDWA